ISILSNCSPLDFQYGCFSLQQQREVGAAPHRGNANRPLRNQGKANAVGTQTKSVAQTEKRRKDQHRRYKTKASRGQKTEIKPAEGNTQQQRPTHPHPHQPRQRT
ncbi:hypothetical protein, partial [Paraburkholderia domus]|uniref:hypothetical protein n=1 Tax=Paraburkholderia domus TaxID=2793075 RepID=UPI001BA6A60C